MSRIKTQKPPRGDEILPEAQAGTFRNLLSMTLSKKVRGCVGRLTWEL
jgi:hypothetical protein